MKNKKTMILFATLAILMMIPIGIFATNLINRIITTPEKPFSKEDLLEEKTKYLNSIEGATILTKDEPQIDEELQNKLNASNAENQEIENSITSILNKNHSTELENILEGLENENSGTNQKENFQYNLYELIINVLENENLTTEEASILKEFLGNQSYEINKYENLQGRF